MSFKDAVAPASTEQIIAVVVGWVLLNIALSRLLDGALLRWEVLLSTLVLFGWVVWAVHYRLEEARQDHYRKHRR